MHEMAISETICRVIENEAKKRGMSRVASARLKIGVMNAFQRENLKLCLDKYTGNPLMSNIRFEIEELPVELECTKCHRHFTDDRFDDPDFAHKTAHALALYTPTPCPYCGCGDLKRVGGNEMELVSISS